jgi:translation elongation factor EF-Tu-like GTPase
MKVMFLDFVATVYFLSAAEGGREKPASGLRPQFHLGEASADCMLDFKEDAELPRGRSYLVDVQLMFPERFGEALRPGAQFRLQCGGRVFARGVVEYLIG